jgi:hypothetical protein
MSSLPEFIAQLTRSSIGCSHGLRHHALQVE